MFYVTKYGMKNNKFCILDLLYTVYIGDYKRYNMKLKYNMKLTYS